jgi:hypothetical protein
LEINELGLAVSHGGPIATASTTDKLAGFPAASGGKNTEKMSDVSARIDITAVAEPGYVAPGVSRDGFHPGREGGAAFRLTAGPQIRMMKAVQNASAAKNGTRWI